MINTLKQYSLQFGIVASLGLASIPLLTMIGYDVNGAISQVSMAQSLRELSQRGWSVSPSDQINRHTAVKSTDGCTNYYELQSWRLPISGTWRTSIVDTWMECEPK